MPPPCSPTLINPQLEAMLFSSKLILPNKKILITLPRVKVVTNSWVWSGLVMLKIAIEVLDATLIISWVRFPYTPVGY